MKKTFIIPIIFVFIIALAPGCPLLEAAQEADFKVADIILRPDRFVYIKLQNISNTPVTIKPGIKEKVFLIIYLDGVKRTGYKLKYFQKRLFRRRGTLLFRTNFRPPPKGKTLRVKAHINPLKILGEKNYRNNILEKRLKAK